jgi:hypothetical protein
VGKLEDFPASPPCPINRAHPCFFSDFNRILIIVILAGVQARN